MNMMHLETQLNTCLYKWNHKCEDLDLSKCIKLKVVSISRVILHVHIYWLPPKEVTATEQFHFADSACPHVVKATRSSGILVDFMFNMKFSKAAYAKLEKLYHLWLTEIWVPWLADLLAFKKIPSLFSYCCPAEYSGVVCGLLHLNGEIGQWGHNL